MSSFKPKSISLLVLAWLCLGASGTVRMNPMDTGKSAGGIGVELRYPAAHPVGHPLKIEVDLWSTDTDADWLAIEVRPLEGTRMSRKFAKKKTFKGPVARYKKDTYSFTVTPIREGESYVAVDVSKKAEGATSSRTFSILLKGGGSLSGAEAGILPPKSP